MAGLIPPLAAGLSLLALSLYASRRGEAGRAAYEAFVFGRLERGGGAPGRRPLRARLETLLQASGAPPPQTLALLATAAALTGAAGGVALTGAALGGLVLAVAAAGGLPWTYLSWRAQRRLGRYLGQIPEALGIVASVVRAGRSVAAAVAEAGRRAGPPLGRDLEWAARQVEAGSPVGEALEALGKRVGVQEFEVFALGARTLRDTGGDLPGLCDAVADLIRERTLARAEIRAVSAEVVSAARFMSLVPLGIALAVRSADPGAYQTLLASPAGVLQTLLAAVVLPATGYALVVGLVRRAV